MIRFCFLPQKSRDEVFGMDNRNFFPPAARWQFSGIRLAEDF
jgi:hypothetical protein